ncbi:glycosyl transferase family 2 [Breoghania corrubedonensis]|uniref:Glycosyl transferase family 2 n=1 Tax=Breoghania corrubedonensis TaxID=665038 RepID=A0A2T5V4L4_9HYPH|nr:glycosyltransferase family 2 protein [Breoghania corrubedonensis]PTW58702.1 glycosyl transferase family 2 [Breoghania corrubedonensis]
MFSNKKSCIVVQTKNSRQYIPAFLAYHLRCVDKIFLIDHNSDKDYRGLATDRVSVFRSRMAIFASDVNINSVLSNFAEIRGFDWVFVLDIDEFLPFSSLSETREFMERHADKSVVSLHWRNGVPVGTVANLTDAAALSFQREPSGTSKMAYNTRLFRNFLITEGNHRPLNLNWGVLGKLRKRFPQDTSYSIFHVPFLSFRNLRDKIRICPPKDFAQKINMTARPLVEKYGQNWLDKEIDTADFTWLVANYRNGCNVIDVRSPNFSMEEVRLFRGLKQNMDVWEAQLDACPRGEVVPGTPAEADFVNRLRKKKKWGYVTTIRRCMRITDDNCIVLNT